MKPIKIDFTPEQLEQIQPIRARVIALNEAGMRCMTAGQVYADGMVIGIISGEKAEQIAGGLQTSSSAQESVGKARGGVA